MTTTTKLQAKLKQFQEGLTELERVRLAQLLRTEFKGTLLAGGAGQETKTIEGVKRDLPEVARQAVNVSLSNKLMSFQAGLDESELSEMLSSLAADSGGRQSSFGVGP